MYLISKIAGGLSKINNFVNVKAKAIIITKDFVGAKGRVKNPVVLYNVNIMYVLCIMIGINNNYDYRMHPSLKYRIVLIKRSIIHGVPEFVLR